MFRAPTTMMESVGHINARRAEREPGVPQRGRVSTKRLLKDNQAASQTLRRWRRRDDVKREGMQPRRMRANLPKQTTLRSLDKQMKMFPLSLVMLRRGVELTKGKIRS